MIYVVETERNLGDPFREYLRDAKNEDKDLSNPVSTHFNFPVHSFKKMSVYSHSLYQGNTESRKTSEQEFILKIGTLAPHGINNPLSFD